MDRRGSTSAHPRTVREIRELANGLVDQLEPGGTNQMAVELDAGLELIGISGPDVKGFRSQQEGEATRVVVAFSSNAPEANPDPL